MIDQRLENEWADVKSKKAVGSVIECRVLAHWNFGVFVSTNSQFVGLIQIPFFKDNHERMTPKEYPELDSTVRAVVLNFNDRNHQIELSARPSDLVKAEAQVAG